MRSLTTTLDSTVADIFRDLNRFAVGFEPTFRMLDQVRNTATTGYPPYDLESIGDDHYRLSMAVAGFTTEDLDITLHDGVLTIEGKAKQSDDKNYLHKGIAGRSFRRTFYLNSMIKVTGSNLANGILTIDFEQEIPESMKPRKIAIGTETPKVIESNASGS
jgi:molecular chaperone IbpA